MNEYEKEQDTKRPRLMLDDISFTKREETPKPAPYQPYFQTGKSFTDKVRDSWRNNPGETVALYVVGCLFFFIGSTASVQQPHRNTPAAVAYQKADISLLQVAHSAVEKIMAKEANTDFTHLKPLFYKNAWANWQETAALNDAKEKDFKKGFLGALVGRSQLVGTTIKHGMVHYQINTEVKVNYVMNGRAVTIPRLVKMNMIENPDNHGEFLISQVLAMPAIK